MRLFNVLIVCLFFNLLLSGCEKNEDNANTPVLRLTPEQVTAKAGRTIEATLFIHAPNGAEKLQMYKTVNLQRDNSFGVSGTLTATPQSIGDNNFEYHFSYQLQDTEVDKLVGFNFRLEDGNAVAAEKDLTVHTTVSGQQIIYGKKWVLKSRMWESATPTPVEDKKACENDDVFSWNRDSTYSVNFGTSACTFDGFNVFDRWLLSEDEKTFTQVYHSLFDPSNITRDTYTVKQLSSDRIVLEQTIDLTVFGLSDKERFVSTYEPAP